MAGFFRYSCYLAAMQILLALLAAASTICPNAADQAVNDYESAALRQCWETQTIALERSAESPNDIATAVINHCYQNITRVDESLKKCVGLPPEELFDREMKAYLVKILRDNITSRVVTIRSKKR